MPPLPDANKIIRCELSFQLQEDLGAKVRFFKRYAGVAPSVADLQEFALDIGELFDSSGLASHMADVYELNEVFCTDLTSATSAAGGDTTVHAGTNSVQPLSAADCVLVSNKIGRRFRGGHSRMYWPLGTTADKSDAQKWGSTFIANVQTDMDAFLGGINSEGWASAGTIDSVALSYYEGFTVFVGTTGRARNVSTPRTAPVIDTITSHVVRQGIASQRGRLLHLA